MVLSGCCQALTHISHTYDTIKRALTIKGVLTPMTPAATQLPPPPTLRDHAGGGGRLGSADGGAGAGGGGTDGGGHSLPDAVGIWL